MKINPLVIIGPLTLLFINPVWADYKDDIGYTLLRNQLGAAMPTGAGVVVVQVEAAENGSNLPAIYAPNPSNDEFSGKSITFPVGGTPVAFSSHATGVGQFFYGNTSSLASGITNIQTYEVDAWLGNINGSTNARIANHSWVGEGQTTSETLNILKLVDRQVYLKQYTQVVAMNNGGISEPLLASAYNGIAVGLTDGSSASGSVGIDATYNAGRAKPDIVAPLAVTSTATPVVASAAALLVQTGHQSASLSHGSSIISGVGTVYNAERSETVKAALMAGADRVTSNTSIADNIVDYRIGGHQIANGLDDRYGAGQLNINNSYQIIAAGEQESGSTIGASGFDFKAAFGGSSGSSRTASYDFTAHGEQALSAALVWNLGVSNNVSLTTTFHHLGLSLIDITDDSAIVAESISQSDNTQNIWLYLLDNHQYELRVNALDPANFSWGYSLAWNIQAVPVPDAVWLFGSAMLGFGFFRKVRPSKGPMDS